MRNINNPESTPMLEVTNSPLSKTQVFKRLSGLALPMAASYTFSLEMWLLVFFLSRLNSDKTHSASITPITDMINALVIIGISPLFAMSMAAGKKYGALKVAQMENENENEHQAAKDAIARVNHHGLIIATAMTPIVALPLVFSESILTDIFRQNPDVAKLSQSFLRPYAIAIPATMLRLCSEQMMFSFARTKPAMFMALFNAVIGMSVAALFGFGKLDAPKLGQDGILMGYILEAYLTAIAFSLYIALHPDFKQYPFFRPKQLVANLGQIREIITIGRPLLLGNTVEMGSILATGAIAGLCGVAAQAAFSTTMQFTLLTFLMQSAFGQSTCQEMSRLIGEKAYFNASQMGKFGLPTALAYVAPLPIIFSIQPKWLLQILGQNDDEKYNTVRILIPLMSMAVLLDAARYNLLQQLRNNLGDGNRATTISSVSLLSGVFLSWALGTQTNLEIFGVALGYIIGEVLATAGLAVRWQSRIAPLAIEKQYEIAAANHSTFFALSRNGALERELLVDNSSPSIPAPNIV